jgi:hypothetical protein
MENFGPIVPPKTIWFIDEIKHIGIILEQFFFRAPIIVAKSFI